MPHFYGDAGSTSESAYLGGLLKSLANGMTYSHMERKKDDACLMSTDLEMYLVRKVVPIQAHVTVRCTYAPGVNPGRPIYRTGPDDLSSLLKHLSISSVRIYHLRRLG